MAQAIPKIKICVLGDGNVGKSALTIRYFQDQFVEDWDPTIEDLYTRKDILKDLGRVKKRQILVFLILPWRGFFKKNVPMHATI